MPEAVAAMKEAFAELSTGAATVPQRLVLPVEDTGGMTLLKAALTARGLGAKLVSVFPANPGRGLPSVTGLMVLLDRQTGLPTALCDGTFLTAWRTGAASGAATDLLAARDARTAALFGCGAQARTQALAIDAVRRLETIRVFARTPGAVEAFLAEMQPRLSARLEAAGSPSRALEGAQVICAATTSDKPVFDGRELDAGVHINGVGSFTAEMQEIDAETVGRARIFVDCHSAARAEAGDLLIAARAGRTRPSEWTELGEVIAGIRPGRGSAEEITFFKSVGVAVQDVAAATRALEEARRLDLGTLVEL